MKQLPPYDLIDGANGSLVLRIALPGIRKANIDLTFKNTELVLKVHRTPSTKIEYLRKGILDYSTETYTWNTDPTLKLDMASYVDGILEVLFSPRIPTPEESGRINIQ